jgi:hypothetical protein
MAVLDPINWLLLIILKVARVFAENNQEDRCTVLESNLSLENYI